MSIYRGSGGASSVSGTAAVEEVLQASVDAQAAAAAAETSKTSAATSAASASTSATNSASSATSSATSATASATSATASQTARTGAETAETNAETAQAAAEVAQAAAETAQSAAETAETNAASSATAAATSETNAATSYANTLAIYGSTTDVQNAVNAAAASETAAAASEAAAATSETNAATSETNAAASETAAASSASAASTSASAASSSATAAASSATAAATSATTAEGWATDSNVITVANNITEITAVGSNISDVSTVATNLTDINQFADRYIISASAPVSPVEGMLWWDTVNDAMKVYDGNSFVLAGSAVNGTSERQTYTLTSPTDTFAANYDVGFVDVYLNGIKLVAGTDFTATDGSNVVLASAAVVGDIVDILSFGAFSVADTYTQATIDSKIAAVNSYTITRTSITAIEGQTVFTASYDVGYVDVYQNGLKLDITQDFTASNGTSITLVEATVAGDVIEVVSGNGAFSVADTYTQAQADARYLQTSAVGTTVQAYDANTMVTDVDQTMTGQLTVAEFTETAYNLTGTVINPANGSIQYKTLAANTTFTESLTDGQSVVLRLEGGATYTVTWPTMTWVTSGGNVAPTLNGTSDVVVLWQENSTVYGAYVGNGA